MAERRTILEKTFALTSQQREGTVTLLDLSVELRKIPATVDQQDNQYNGPVIITTTRRYAQGQILVDGDLTEVEETEVPAEPEEATAVPVGIARQEIINLTETDDENTEDTQSEDSDTTERNPDLADEGERSEEGGNSDPHLADDDAASRNSGEPDSDPRDAPPPYSPEPSSRRRDSDQRREFRDGVRSPSPPGYMPSYYLQNLYSPPILLRSEEEYRHHRRELIRQHKRDCLDLYYKYEFYSQQLKRARRQYY
ncbi:hypothetical protein DAPPUDRAFT_330396 [Daphnia pulex]|uniref:Uncharacterized protein n=1 Tax=Daphnia pulex TaxID=6669 RepID=E9HJG1_DAPPU|nr:hypothetical protein DAPPUDRAFT_330396 [Daphnia pulex]|eukprot:EFX68081.1 hypothetical protein DAPPUDRAFT_330396 [Daphnia pulex]